jgi:protein phosphatase
VLEQLTEDHSLVNEQVKSGLITAEEAKTHQFKNIITRSVGVTPEVEVDVVTKN